MNTIFMPIAPFLLTVIVDKDAQGILVGQGIDYKDSSGGISRVAASDGPVPEKLAEICFSILNFPDHYRYQKRLFNYLALLAFSRQKLYFSYADQISEARFLKKPNLN